MPTSSPPEYRDKFVAFIDVLGFKQMVEQSTRGDGETLSEVLAMLEAFGTQNERSLFQQYGPMVCPCSRVIERSILPECVIRRRLTDAPSPNRSDLIAQQRRLAVIRLDEEAPTQRVKPINFSSSLQISRHTCDAEFYLPPPP
ncbi:hypothetical protein AQB9606_03053 [Aquabacterium sp. CECT 9606]|nr:hypothetical protein AQB9606_03053 [Aquabacterium sp. CECT 9606]